MSKVAFLGLGMMGTQMARRLIEAGNEVTVWNRSRERAEPLAKVASGVADSPAKAVPGAEFVITMLANPQAVDAVLFGEDAAAAALEQGQVWIDMSTVGPDEFRKAASRVPQGVVTVDAPVRGSVPEASEGRLHVFVGSSDSVFERVQPLLSVLGDVHHTGGPGTGAATKLVVNLALVSAMVAFGESLSLAESLGLERGPVMDALEDSPIAGVVRAKRANIESSQYPPAFKLELAAKDMRLVGQAAAAAGLTLPEAAAVEQWMDRAMDSGAGKLDFSAVAATILDEAKSRHDR
jgi:3-hydroxyisobutyrate dehydrogenase-like beta-hydroxyacid dehydrogenase